MKSLKRTLCLVLALVMVLGLFGIASATSFTDDNSIQYKEAVDVMTGIGAINGMGDGTFNPKGTITRAQAAKLVVYTMLGATAAEKQLSAGTASSFSDVPAAYDWAIPSIEYLVKTGAINGRGDGTFDPEGKVTGYELGKLLLCAIGYGVKNEYTGAGWDLQVTIDGSRMGPVSYGGANRRLSVFSDRAAGAGKLDAPATREEAALYCFNAIQKLKVEYVSALDIYADGTNSLGVAKGSIGTNIYPTLTRPDTGDIFGNPGYQWKLGGVNLYATTYTPIVTFTSEKTVDDLKKAVVSAGYNWKDDTTTVITGYNPVTGAPITASVPVVNILKNDQPGDIGTNLTDMKAVAVGDGMTLKAYDDGNRNLNLITVVNTYVGQVTGVTDDNAATSDIDERALEVTLLSGTKITASPIDGTQGFDAAFTATKTMMAAGSKMFLIVAPKGTTALSVEIPSVSELRISSVTADEAGVNKSFVADGKTYSFAAYTPDPVKNSVKANSTYKVLTNSYGYVVLVDLVTANENIGVVVKAGDTPAAFGEIPTLKVVTPTGEEVDLPMSSWNGTPTPAGTPIEGSKANYQNRIVKYTPDTGANAGKYAVTDITTSVYNGSNSAVTIADGTDVEIKTGATNIGNLGVYANSQTVFVIGTVENGKPVYNVYTGVDNVPNVKATGTLSNGPVYSYSVANGYATVFYINNSAIQFDASKISFVAVGSEPTALADGRTVIRSAIISGTSLMDIKEVFIPVTLLVSSTIVDAQLNPVNAPFIIEYKVEDEQVEGVDVVKSLTLLPSDDPETQGMMGVGTKAPEKSIVGLGTTVPNSNVNHTYTDNVSVWVIDPEKTVVTQKFQHGGINDIMDSLTNKVCWLQSKKTANQVSAVYVVKSNVVPTTLAVAADNAAVVQVTDNSGDPAYAWKDAVTLTATVTPAANVGTADWEYAWAIVNADGTVKKALTGTTRTLALTASDFTTAGTYKIRCIATDKNDLYPETSKTIDLTVAVNYEVPATTITAAATGWTKGSETAGFTTDGKCEFTIEAGTTITAGDTLTVAITGGGNDKVVKFSTDGGTNTSDYVAAGITLAAAPAAATTYTFIVSGVTAPITAITFTVTPA